MLSINTRTKRSLHRLEGLFAIPRAEMKTIIRDFHAEMGRGLAQEAGSLKMLPSYLHRPSGDEKGAFMAIDLGGTNLRVLSLELKGRRRIGMVNAQKFLLQKRHITGTAGSFFGSIARCVGNFISKGRGRAGRADGLGFTFSFPVKQTGVASGKLVRWTKGFNVRGVEGRDVVELFNDALETNKIRGTRVSVLMNDTVGTLMARSYKDPACDVGVILGTGTNAAYVEKMSNIGKLSGCSMPGGEMIINIEWGDFDKLRVTPYDRQLDKASRNPGRQVLEKMVSGMYLGELARLACADIGIRGIKKDAFKSEHVSRIEADRSKSLSDVAKALSELGVKAATMEERMLVKKVCELVSLRAARVSAAALVAVVTEMDPELSRTHTVAIDGSVYEKHPNFPAHMYDAIREVLGKKAQRIKIILTKDGSGIGAAIAASTVHA